MNQILVRVPCTKCKLLRDPDRDFHKNSSKTLGRDSECKSCKAKRSVALNLKQYGLDERAYDTMLFKQGGVCALCRNPETVLDPTTNKPRRLAVDHDHSSGAVRGLLCCSCNTGLGKLRDDPVLLLAASKYVASCGKVVPEKPR